MRTTLATLCAVLVLTGCERRADRDTAAEAERSNNDTVTTTMAAGDTAATAAGGLDWQPAPPFLPAGARAAVTQGDPTKPGVFVLQLDMPAGYEVRPHHHPMAEQVTVIEGNTMLGRGKEWVEDKMKSQAVGDKATLGAKEPHYIRAKVRSIVEVRSEGPFEITYINPADDPRKKPVP